jgi:hypothetical protein
MKCGDSGAINGMSIPKYCPSGALSTTDPTCLEPGSNPDRRGRNPVTDRLSYSMAMCPVSIGAARQWSSTWSRRKHLTGYVKLETNIVSWQTLILDANYMSCITWIIYNSGGTKLKRNYIWQYEN